jgi:hypothetical protein
MNRLFDWITGALLCASAIMIWQGLNNNIEGREMIGKLKLLHELQTTK